MRVEVTDWKDIGLSSMRLWQVAVHMTVATMARVLKEKILILILIISKYIYLQQTK
jgi:hypothetical protein